MGRSVSSLNGRALETREDTDHDLEEDVRVFEERREEAIGKREMREEDSDEDEESELGEEVDFEEEEVDAGFAEEEVEECFDSEEAEAEGSEASFTGAAL